MEKKYYMPNLTNKKLKFWKVMAKYEKDVRD